MSQTGTSHDRPAPDSPRLAIRAFGGVHAELDGVAVDLGGPRQRAVLALLLVAHGVVVPAAQLAEELWDGGAPANPTAVLQSYVSHLRRAISPESAARSRRAVLVSEGLGYACRLPDDAVDAWRFQALVRDGVALGEDGAAIEPLRSALALWRGDPYAEHAGEAWADAEAARLRALRDLAREHLVGARLAAGEHAALMPELQALVEEDPLREDRWRLLALALYRSGRQAHALDALREARANLADQLGVDPGPALRELEAQILSQDRRLDRPTGAGGLAAAPAAAAEPPSAPVPSPSRTAPAGARAAGDALVERETEVGALQRAIGDAVGGLGGVVVVEGPAGIGKTRLLAELRESASALGVRVLHARGSRLEREFGFGLVRQLFEPVLADEATRARLLTGSAAAAAPVFDLSDASRSADPSFATLHGLYWMALRLAELQPLLIAVDDVQWSDPGSLRFLAYLGRRVADQRLLVAVTRRSGEPEADDPALVDLVQDPAVLAFEPGPLSREGSRALVEERLGSSDEAFVAACHRTTGGNPLLLRQLVRALEAEHVRPDRAHAETVNAIGSRAIANVVLRRLDALGGDVVDVARAVAVLGDGCAIATVASFTDLPDTRVAEAAAIAAAAELLRDEHALAFVHPIVRDAVYQSLNAARRGLAHERAARLLHVASGAPEAVAAHLLQAPGRGEPWAVEALVRAATVARERGAPDSAAVYLARAIDEPAPIAARGALLAELGTVEMLSNGAAALEHLHQAYVELPPGQLAADVAGRIAQTHVFVGPPGSATAFATAAADATPPELIDVRQRLEAVARIGGYIHGLDPAVWQARAVEIEGDGLGARTLAAILAWERLMTSDHLPEARRLAEFALADPAIVEIDPGLYWPIAADVLDWTGADSDRHWDEGLARAYQTGSLFSSLSAHLWRGVSLWFRGDLREAQHSFRTANEQCIEWGAPIVAVAYGEAFLVRVLLDRGDVPAARAFFDSVADRPRLGDGLRLITESEGLLLLAEGRVDEALAVLGDAEALMTSVENPVWRHWRSLRALALAARSSDDLPEAIDLVTEELALAQRWGAPRGIGRALRIRGELRGADGRADLEEAVEVLSGANAELELARAHAALAALEPAPLDAERTRRAFELARSCGADALAASCAERLAVLGVALPPAADGLARLTSTERRVVEQLAAGADVNEIAERLFVTPRAVREAVAEARRELGAEDDAALRRIAVAAGAASPVRP
ncbi:BTAD domain-containing putative transcriptional regulator [Agromyces sp. MMS24-K17]|uniref:BTAD domain-containing putative transcriptional regulator n=1 Tax=Agromyces sp. MMS24-K17 TaxID=3372850 RepID=UPI003754C550